MLGYSNAKFTIYNTYSTGTVIGDTSVGGLIGYFGGYNSAVYVFVFYSYSTGYIRSSNTPFVGGLIGQKGGYSTVTNCYWDMNTSGQTTSNGGVAVGKTTTQMKAQSTFTDWNFSGIWSINEGSSYPYISTNEQTPYPTPIDVPSPVLIYTADDLNNIRNNMTRTANYSLANDIDLNVSPYKDGNGWLPIGTDTNAFAGIFNANGHIIRNLYINRSSTDYVGLFGYVNKYAQINDLNLVDVNVRGKTYVGAIAGMSYTGKILRSNVTGLVNATSYVGGLVGYQYSGSTTYSYSNCSVTSSSTGYIGGLIGYLDSGNVSYCYSSGAVTGGSFAGGAIGYSSGASSFVAYNYSTSPVSGATYVGGFVGYINSGVISTNYSIGTVTGSSSVGGLVGGKYSGSASYCFWDMNTSGRATSSTGTGKTTTEMKTQSTFTYWDFSTIWNMTEGTTYPYLRSNTQSPLPQ